MNWPHEFWVENSVSEVTSAWKYDPASQSDFSTIRVIEYDAYKKLESLFRIMVDPENDPPQLTKAEAWSKYLEINSPAWSAEK